MNTGTTTTSDVVRRGELLQLLDGANRRIHALDEEVRSAGEIVQFRMIRHVQWLMELLADLNARSVDMPAAHTDERRRFEHDLGSLEREVVIAEAKLQAARAEQNAYLRPGPQAELRAIREDVSSVMSEFHRPVSFDG